MSTPTRSSTDVWLRTWRPIQHATARLVVFPHAGGSASFYRGWCDDLGATFDVRVVQYPGREDRLADPFCRDLQELASQLADALLSTNDVPIALFGHSMGAIVAYEVALRLEAERRSRLSHLFVSGRAAPHRRLGGSVHRSPERGLLDELTRVGGTSATVLEHPELRALVLPSVRDDYRLIETYRPAEGRTLNCPITACLGDHDAEASVEDVQAWRDYTRSDFELHIFPGDHFYLVPRRADVTGAILRCRPTRPFTSGDWPSTP